MSVLAPGLIVSLTPSLESPWRTPGDIARLAVAAAEGGASAVKVDGPAAIRAVRAVLPEFPLLAVSIDGSHGGVVRITPTLEHARELVEAGADVVEIEADSASRRADGQDMAELIAQICALGRPVKAGVPNLADALVAVRAGAVIVSSSTMGYPAGVSVGPLPDLDLVSTLVAGAGVPVVAERGYSTLAHLAEARSRGAHAVVVGSAIVDPVWLTRSFVAGWN
ncbi:beta/alpha barrel domain-containing protein [Mycetocola spongiae]|uniref:N-acetylmannosamine-6-phosphate 2-epimerase n=1 Tax=Mycetocola spongiae TaxID=2859226 RepID=UPI001CF1A159|nr:N-acetylmannosamine-6-phosphate 2-epimerase [Mycetocola spongiae]UCR88066.1 N-acetylmannosamine-6-phosphate 2-epimerase [Mycetocola spongiae]